MVQQLPARVRAVILVLTLPAAIIIVAVLGGALIGISAEEAIGRLIDALSDPGSHTYGTPR